MPNDIWTTPADWAVNEKPVSSTKLNQQLRDNMYALWLAATAGSSAITPANRTLYASLSGLTATADLFPDAATNTYRGGLRVPTDWVSGTDIILRMYFVQIATAGSPTGVFRSWISAWANAENVSAGIDNIESNVNVNTICTQYIMTGIARTITGASIQATDNIQWAIQRQGADAADTVNAAILIRGAWAEYTARPNP